MITFEPKEPGAIQCACGQPLTRWSLFQRPFDDALPHQQLNGFLIIKELMAGTHPDSAGK
jgi:hypothetical protein